MGRIRPFHIMSVCEKDRIFHAAAFLHATYVACKYTGKDCNMTI